MAIEFFTGFEGCALVEDVNALFDYSSRLSIYPTGGFPSGKYVSGTYTHSGIYRMAKDTTATKDKTFGGHIYYAYQTTATDRWLFYISGPQIRINNTNAGFTVFVNEVSVGSIGDGIDTNWHHVEVKVLSDAVSGSVEIKVDGTSIGSLTGIDTGGEDITRVYWGDSGLGGGSTPYFRWDNIFIADDWQGEIYSVLLTPNSDASVEFDPSSGVDNYAMLQTDDGDTSYVQSDTLGSKDLYDYEDLPAGLVPQAVTTVTVAKKAGTGERTFQAITKQDSTEYDVADAYTLTTSYPNSTAHQSVNRTYALAPDGTEWTASKVNAIQFGFKVPA